MVEDISIPNLPASGPLVPTDLFVVEQATGTVKVNLQQLINIMSSGVTMSTVNSAIANAIANLVNSAPGTLDTLKELADALGDDPNFAATTATALSARELLANKATNLSSNDDTHYPTVKAVNLAIAAAIGTIPPVNFASLAGSPSDNAALSAVLSQLATDRINGDANLQTQVSALSSALIPHPTYTAPTAGISSSQSTSGLEIGQTINIPLTATFNQNDGGASTGLSIKKNGTPIATASPYTDNVVVMSATPVNYLVNYAYGQGPVKNNLIGVPDATGRIAAGNVNSGPLSYQGYYRVWYDTVATLPTDSASVRALSNTRFSNSGNTFTLNTGTVNLKFCIILPPGKTLVSVVDQDALNLDITAQYVQTSITVNDAAGNPVTTYKMYAMTQSVPYSTSHRHNITIA